MITLIPPVTFASVLVSTYMRRGSGSRLSPVPISVAISTLSSILVSVLGTAPRLETLPGAASISSSLSLVIPQSWFLLPYL